MLVLSRRNRESVMIGGSISLSELLKLTVLEIRGGTVKLGFEADSRITVQRLEIWERIHAGEQQSHPFGTIVDDRCTPVVGALLKPGQMSGRPDDHR